MTPNQKARPTALVVSESLLTREVLSMILEGESFQVNAVESGTRALEADRSPTPDIILLDIDLPETDAWRVLSKLRELKHLAGVPVVIVSTAEQRLGWVLALSRGAQAHLLKPFTSSDVVGIVRRLMAIQGHGPPRGPEAAAFEVCGATEGASNNRNGPPGTPDAHPDATLVRK